MTAEQIVRALAADEPIVWSSGGEWHACGVCDASLPMKAEDHEADCPWRLAVEWVEANTA
jgi:hypothetical protein